MDRLIPLLDFKVRLVVWQLDTYQDCIATVLVAVLAGISNVSCGCSIGEKERQSSIVLALSSCSYPISIHPICRGIWSKVDFFAATATIVVTAAVITKTVYTAFCAMIDMTISDRASCYFNLFFVPPALNFVSSIWLLSIST